MAGELITAGGSALTTALSGSGMEDMMKPLTREIHLFDTNVAGTSFLPDQSVLELLQIGDRLNLRREENKFDRNAILVLTEKGQKVGYVPEKDNLIFSRLMDAGKLLIARIEKITHRTEYTQIAIGIYLVDF